MKAPQRIGSMRLRIILPGEILLDEPVVKVVAEAENGSFGLLPRHADFVTALVPGVVAYTAEAGEERFVGTDEAVLVKIADDVMISARGAVAGARLNELEAEIERKYRRLDDRERAARSALARLEAGLARRFIEMQGEPGRWP